jgi:hypothetical protein
MGDLFPAYNVWNQAGVMGQVTANFGATALAFAAPTGFSTFDTIPVPPTPPATPRGGPALYPDRRVLRDKERRALADEDDAEAMLLLVH